MKDLVFDNPWWPSWVNWTTLCCSLTGRTSCVSFTIRVCSALMQSSSWHSRIEHSIYVCSRQSSFLHFMPSACVHGFDCCLQCWILCNSKLNLFRVNAVGTSESRLKLAYCSAIFSCRLETIFLFDKCRDVWSVELSFTGLYCIVIAYGCRRKAQRAILVVGDGLSQIVSEGRWSVTTGNGAPLTPMLLPSLSVSSTVQH